MLEGNDRLAAEVEYLGEPVDESKPKCVTDPPNWVSLRLREAGNILADEKHTSHVDRLLFALADRAEFMERNDIYPLRESNWGTVFANAVIFASGIVEESNGTD